MSQAQLHIQQTYSAKYVAKQKRDDVSVSHKANQPTLLDELKCPKAILRLAVETPAWPLWGVAIWVIYDYPSFMSIVWITHFLVLAIGITLHLNSKDSSDIIADSFLDAASFIMLITAAFAGRELLQGFYMRYFILSLSLVLLFKLYRTFKQLWSEANIAQLERRLIDTFVKDSVVLQVTVAGLGTLIVRPKPPGTSEATTSPATSDGGAASLPVVLIHGWSISNVNWLTVLDSVASSSRVVYCVEWLGVGRSLKPNFTPKSFDEAEQWFTNSFENWRKEMKLDRFILAGHSMGGLMSCHYTEKHPNRVAKLLLLSCAGITPMPSASDLPKTLRGSLYSVIRTLWEDLEMSPLDVYRLAGPFTSPLASYMWKWRIQGTPPSSLMRSMTSEGAEAFVQYLHVLWTAKPSGEYAVLRFLQPRGWARRPLRDHINSARFPMPIAFIYGAKHLDSMDSKPVEHLIARLEREEGRTDIRLHIVPDTTHSMFFDDPVAVARVMLLELERLG